MQYRVELERKKSLSDYQNSRKRVEYVEAKNDQQALAIATRRCPEFIAISVRRS
jgi:hypothetical protein